MRALRTAGGRRALQLALLVGGLLALGFLCGTQAQAAEGTPSVRPVTSPLLRSGHQGVARTVTAPSATAPAAKDSTAAGGPATARPATAEPTGGKPATAGSVTERAVATVQETTAGGVAERAVTSVRKVTGGAVTERVTSVQGTTDGSVTGRAVTAVQESTSGGVVGRAVSSVQGGTGGTVVGRTVTSVEAVAEQVVTPVRTVVRETSGALDEVRATTLPGATSLPAQGLPVPGLPVPGVPGVPGVSDPLPAQQWPVPVTPAPGADRPGGVAPAAGRADRPGTGIAKGDGRHRAAAPVRPSGATYGPGAVPAPAQAPVRTPSARATAPAGAPAKLPTPSGDPDGALGKQAADGTASRHGDAHAVALDGRAPVRLLAGATVGVDAPGTRERHRDIPLFPG
ncbi:hypothetical protein [Streptomyces sp. NPDC052292]|uniref:hypothetical protein n=1 Tax=Streptomyces sp. NPDC052292 TaxID=3155053 RepID=UPI00341E074F